MWGFTKGGSRIKNAREFLKPRPLSVDPAHSRSKMVVRCGIDIIHLDRDWKRARRPIELHYVGLALCRLRSHGRC